MPDRSNDPDRRPQSEVESKVEPDLDLGRADAYGRAFAEVYDRWYEGVTDADATAEFLAARCRSSRSGSVATVLELGVGTGRLAAPMAARGLRVVGVDGSAAMLAPLAAEPVPGVDVVRADMRALPFRVAPRFDGVLIAFNTLFNLASKQDQADVLRTSAELLAPGGVLVIEALDAVALGRGPSRSIGVGRSSEDGLVVSATIVEPDAQTIDGTHIDIGHDGVSRRPWRLRWLTIDQLDRLAAAVGLTPHERYADWSGTPFGPGADTHISVYRLVSA